MERMSQDRGRKLNNVGMSLVEVVIAMAILSIVILGVLHSFVYSARYNARSRLRQQTTAAAQTVMENFKAYSVQDIYNMFETNSFILNGGVGGAHTGVPGGDMTFDITGMLYQNDTYDVRVSLSGHNSLAADVTTLNYENPTLEHTAVYVGYAGMDGDALTGIMNEVAQEWSNLENAALLGGATPAPGATPDPSATSAPTAAHSLYEVDSSKIHITKRELKVNISADGHVATVNCVYSYKVNGHPYITDAYGTPGTFDLAERSYEIDLSGSTVEGHSLGKEIFNQPTKLEALTLYYYPAYPYVPSSSDPSAPVQIGEDHIYISNSSDKDVKCCIYKQKNLAVSDSRLTIFENVYEVNLHLDHAYVYDDNLDKVLGSDVGSIAGSKIHVYGTNAEDKRYHGIGYAAVYTNYPTTGDYSPAIPTPMPTSAPTSTSEPIKPTSENLRIMYNIKIDIYEHVGGSTAFTTVLNTLEGTIIE